MKKHILFTQTTHDAQGLLLQSNGLLAELMPLSISGFFSIPFIAALWTGGLFLVPWYVIIFVSAFSLFSLGLFAVCLWGCVHSFSLRVSDGAYTLKSKGLFAGRTAMFVPQQFSHVEVLFSPCGKECFLHLMPADVGVPMLSFPCNGAEDEGLCECHLENSLACSGLIKPVIFDHLKVSVGVGKDG